MDLSIVIPARNEMFLKQTIEDILKHKKGNTEIIVGLDGAWADPVLPQYDDLNVIYEPVSIGQRAMTNQCVRFAQGKYIMKVDAHCSFDDGFDVKMIEGFKQVGDNVTMVPVMRNLHVFDWKCYKCGWKTYQGKTPEKCPDCGATGKYIRRKMRWVGKSNPQSTSYCFDSEPHFQYFKEWTKTDTYKEQLKTGFTETMSLQGSCFMVTKDKYWELNLSDEQFGSWGSQGIEVACKTWLSGMRVLVNHSTWYAHLFRTQGGDFSFPYPQSISQVQNAKKRAKDIFFNNKWVKQEKPLLWLIEKFWPVKGWTDEDLQKLKEYASR